MDDLKARVWVYAVSMPEILGSKGVRKPQVICSDYGAVYERMVFVSCLIGLPTGYAGHGGEGRNSHVSKTTKLNSQHSNTP